jgi:hypothetical protein
LPLVVATYAWLVAPAMRAAPSYHWFPLALLDVSVTLPPVQNVVGPPALTVGVAGVGVTVTVVDVEAALGQPLVVTMTL